jgi:hypothetical protein
MILSIPISLLERVKVRSRPCSTAPRIIQLEIMYG